MYWTIIGIVAASLTTFGFVPQVVKMLRTRSVLDVSLPAMIQLGLGMSIWVLYRAHLEDEVIIGANCVGAAIMLTAIVVYLYYVKKDRQLR